MNDQSLEYYECQGSLIKDFYDKIFNEIAESQIKYSFNKLEEEEDRDGN